MTLSIREYQALFEVNLTDYLDTGLFLDHRLVRKELFDKCQGLDVLNLFAYTCSASVQAALAVLIEWCRWICRKPICSGVSATLT